MKANISPGGGGVGQNIHIIGVIHILVYLIEFENGLICLWQEFADMFARINETPKFRSFFIKQNY